MTHSAIAAAPRQRAAAPERSTSSRPRLTVVARPRPRRSSIPFALLCTVIIVGTLATVLLLNISMSDTSYRIARLQEQSRSLEASAQELREQNEKLSTPQELRSRAEELGMVPAAQPAYIDLSTGKIIGTPQAAAGTAPAETRTVPPASIYGDQEPQYGMGGPNT